MVRVVQDAVTEAVTSIAGLSHEEAARDAKKASDDLRDGVMPESSAPSLFGGSESSATDAGAAATNLATENGKTVDEQVAAAAAAAAAIAKASGVPLDEQIQAAVQAAAAAAKSAGQSVDERSKVAASTGWKRAEPQA